MKQTNMNTSSCKR